MPRVDRTRSGSLGTTRALALVLLTSGCFGGQTGQENEASSGNLDPCKAAPSSPIGLDEETPLGYRPRDIVAETTIGEYLPLEWSWPEPSSTQIQVTFQLDTDSARWVSGGHCPGFVAFDAKVLVATGDDQVQATFDDVLVMSAAQDATFSSTVPVAEVRGRFDAAGAIDPRQLADPRLRLQLSIAQGEVHGQLSLEGRDPNPNDSTSPTSPFLGSF